MPRIWFTADHPFGHANILSPKMHCERCEHFSSASEMDEAMIESWNAIVAPDDIVWHLGDFAYKTSFEHAERIFKRLRGQKHLVVGNHEKLGRQLSWCSQQDFAQITVDTFSGKKHVVLMHYAMRTWPRSHRGALHLFGHSHGSLPGTRQSYGVGVDVWQFRPVSLEEVMTAMAKMEPVRDGAGAFSTDEETKCT